MDYLLSADDQGASAWNGLAFASVSCPLWAAIVVQSHSERQSCTKSI